MRNTILRKRITKVIATAYAMNDEDIWIAYERLNSLEKVLNLLETNQLQKIKEILS